MATTRDSSGGLIVRILQYPPSTLQEEVSTIPLRVHVSNPDIQILMQVLTHDDFVGFH